MPAVQPLRKKEKKNALYYRAWMDASCTDRRSLAIGQKGSELKFAIPVKENVRQMIVISAS